MLSQIQLQAGYNYVAKLQDMAMAFAPKLIGAILVYIIGSFIIRKLVDVLSNIMNRKIMTNHCKVFCFL